MSSVMESKTRQSNSEVEELDAFVGGSREEGGGVDELGGLKFDALVDENVEVELFDAQQAVSLLVVMAETAAASLVTCSVRSAVTEFLVEALFAALRVDFLRPSL
jgi:hypothetical protein